MWPRSLKSWPASCPPQYPSIDQRSSDHPMEEVLDGFKVTVGNSRSWIRCKEEAPNWKVPCRRRVVARDSQSPVSDDGQADPVIWSCRSTGCGHHGDLLAWIHGMCRSLPRWTS